MDDKMRGSTPAATGKAAATKPVPAKAKLVRAKASETPKGPSISAPVAAQKPASATPPAPAPKAPAAAAKPAHSVTSVAAIKAAIEPKPLPKVDAPAQAPKVEASKVEAAKVEAGKVEAGKAPPKPAAPETVAIKPVEAKQVEAKPVVAQPTEAKPVVAKPAETKPVEVMAATPKADATKVDAAKSAPAMPKPAAVASKPTPAAPRPAPAVAVAARIAPLPAHLDVAAAVKPMAAAMETGAEQARAVYARAHETSEQLRHAVTESTSAAARGLVQINGQVLDLMRAQSDALFSMWRSTVTAPSLSDAIKAQTSGARQTYEATASHLKGLAETTTRMMGDVAAPVQAALADASKR